MAEATRLVTIVEGVEGVETETECGLLRAHGMLLGQGYLWSRPLPSGEFTGLLLPAVSLGA